MARIVSCGSPRSCVHIVREYCVRLLRGSSASAPDARQAASANIVPMRFPTDPSIKPGDRRNVIRFRDIARTGERSVCPRVPRVPGSRVLLGWAFRPRKLMKNRHGDFIATHERPRDSQDWHGFPAHFAGNSLPVLSVPGFGAHSPRWFFEPVGMGLRPAKLHEKRRKPQEIPRCARWFFAPERLPIWLHRHLRAPPRRTRLALIAGACCRKFAASPVCPRVRSPLPAVVFRTCSRFALFPKTAKHPVIPRRTIAYNQRIGSRYMTDSGTDSTTLTWSVPECPFTIESSARVLDDIRLAVTDAFFSLPRGGAEIGGILLGKFDHGRLVIGDYAALDCEHAHGPSFVLSPPDEVRLKEVLSAHANHAGGLRPVGWYHSHTRSEIFLSEADLQIHQRFFPECWQVALVIKPHTFQPARIGFFFRQADGSVHANASYREDSLDALSIRPMPDGAPTAGPWNEPPPRNFRAAPVAAPVPESAPPPEAAAHPATPEAAPLPEPAAVELPVSKFVIESASSARRWMVVG